MAEEYPAFVTDIPRVPADLIAALRRYGAATIHEAFGRRGALDHTIRPIIPGMQLCGTALTVRCQPADNLTLHAAIALAREGDVIVADVGACLEAGHWGEITTVAAQARGIAGLVINGGVRDVAAIKERRFSVFAPSVSMKATVKRTPGTLNHPVVCGGVLVRPGDLVLGDDDGVVVVAREQAEQVLATAAEREAYEAEVMRELEAGRLTLDLLGFRQTLERHGINL